MVVTEKSSPISDQSATNLNMDSMTEEGRLRAVLLSDSRNGKANLVNDSEEEEEEENTLKPADFDDGVIHVNPRNNGRGKWDSKLEYFLSTLGCAVGLGNVWRFPYLCYRNGGGAFLVPYLLSVFILGIPIMFLEISLGQFSSNGPLTCWDFAPIFRGLGLGRVLACAFTALNYNMVIGWSIYYFFASFTTYLPWQSCDNSWNDQHCSMGSITDVTCVTIYNGTLQANGTCYTVNGSFVGIYDSRMYINATGHKPELPSQQYYDNEFLKVSSGIDNVGQPLWTLSLCLLLAWIMVFFTLCKGVKSVGKAAYFTSLFPYVVLLILLTRGSILPNAIQGIKFYMSPEWSKLSDVRVWYDAALQVFYSLSVGGGGMITLASYNPFRNNVQKDALCICLMNSATSIIAGFLVFSYIGYMAGELNVPVEEVAKDGAGLAFVIYPAAVSLMPVSPLWAILFFGMLVCLGISSEVIDVENLSTAIVDMWPKQLRPHKFWVTTALCIGGFLFGLSLCTNGGVYVVALLDTYGGGWTCFIVGFLQMTSLAWVYGYERFARDIQTMIGHPPSIFWKITWKYVSPVTIVLIVTFSWADFSLLRYDDYDFPAWADGLGFLICLSSTMAIFLYAVYLVIIDKGTFVQRMRRLCNPTVLWGPAKVCDRQLVADAGYADGFVVNPWQISSNDSHV